MISFSVAVVVDKKTKILCGQLSDRVQLAITKLSTENLRQVVHRSLSCPQIIFFLSKNFII